MPASLSTTRIRRIRKIALALMFALLVSPAALPAGLPRGEKHEGRHQIDRLEEAWRVAILEGSAAKLSVLLDDDYMGITARGMLLNKEQTLARLTNGRAHYTSLELSDRKVRFYGATAVVTSLAQAAGTNAEGEEVTGGFRYTRVYVRDERGKWKIVSFEASRIREPGERR